MKKWFIILLITFACSESEEPTPTQTLSEEVLTEINRHRQSQNLEPLIWEENCETQSKIHSQNMANGNLPLGHDGFEARLQSVFDATGAMSGAENVASGYETAEDVVNAWLDSPGHRQNIEGDYTHSGIGIATSSDGEKFYTHIFIKL